MNEDAATAVFSSFGRPSPKRGLDPEAPAPHAFAPQRAWRSGRWLEARAGFATGVRDCVFFEGEAACQAHGTRPEPASTARSPSRSEPDRRMPCRKEARITRSIPLAR